VERGNLVLVDEPETTILNFHYIRHVQPAACLPGRCSPPFAVMPSLWHCFLALHTFANNCFQGRSTGRVKFHQNSDKCSESSLRIAATATEPGWCVTSTKIRSLIPFLQNRTIQGNLQTPAEPGEMGTLQQFYCSEIFILFLCLGCCVLVLESVNLLRKYISILDVFLSCLLPRDALFILTEEETEQARVRLFVLA